MSDHHLQPRGRARPFGKSSMTLDRERCRARPSVRPRDQRRLVGQRSGDGHALLLAAAQHLGIGMLTARDVKVVQQLASALPAVALCLRTRKAIRRSPRREKRRQVRLLGTRSRGAACAGEQDSPAARRPSRRGPLKEHFTARQANKPSALMSVDLPEPLGPSNAATVPARDREADMVQRLHRGRTHPYVLLRSTARTVFHRQPSSARDGSMRMT